MSESSNSFCRTRPCLNRCSGSLKRLAAVLLYFQHETSVVGRLFRAVRLAGLIAHCPLPKQSRIIPGPNSVSYLLEPLNSLRGRIKSITLFQYATWALFQPCLPDLHMAKNQKPGPKPAPEPAPERPRTLHFHMNCKAGTTTTWPGSYLPKTL